MMRSALAISFFVHYATAATSTACGKALLEYYSCDAHNALYEICSNPVLLNQSFVQNHLGCNRSPAPEKNLKECQQQCSELLGHLAGVPLDGPCAQGTQMMRSFSGKVDWLVVPTPDEGLNMSIAHLLPLINSMSNQGVGLSDMGAPQQCAGVAGARYCVVGGTVKIIPSMPSPVRLGLCLPEACSEPDLQNMLRRVLPPQFEVQHGAKIWVQCDIVEAQRTSISVGGQLRSTNWLDQMAVLITYPYKYPWTWQAWTSLACCLMLLACVARGTMLEARVTKHSSDESGRSATVGSAASARLPALLGSHQANVVTDNRPKHPLIQQPVSEHNPEAVERSATEYQNFNNDAASSHVAQGRQTLQYFGGSFFKEFSLMKNGRALKEIRTSEKNTFACLDAMRVLSMMWVLFGHTFFYVALTSGLSNYEQVLPPLGLMGQWWFQLVPGGYYAVDTFLWMSGFLCAISLQKRVFSQLDRTTCKSFAKMYPLFVLSRYLRLLPTELFCMMFFGNLLTHMGEGVIWSLDGGSCMATAVAPTCSNQWWANALFAQNFWPQWPTKISECMGHTWYLAVDMQLYILVPFFSFAYGRGSRIGWSLLALATIGSVVANVLVLMQTKMVPSEMLGGPEFFGKFYAMPWIRAEPFLVGVGFAWLWKSHLARHQPTFATSAVGCMIVVILFFCCVFWGPHNLTACDMQTCMNFDTHPMGKFGLVAWGSLSRLAWGFLLSTFATLSFHKRFIPVIQEFLVLDFWQPLAKLCYCAYLIHPAWLVLEYCQRNDALEYSTREMLSHFVSVLTCTFGTSLAVYLLVEQPLANLQSKLMSKIARGVA
eukprot:TRINITY_DN71486_c0_g1_i1.p1 TRINITY_DN71486_c0_g1~~TRINITY_DN71486_c0_g1_i1.p1  ORF type:complete len:850 (-),score=55.07 TRINITY_DN71486_c0_g1_i1:91-2568(-)